VLYLDDMGFTKVIGWRPRAVSLPVLCATTLVARVLWSCWAGFTDRQSAADVSNCLQLPLGGISGERAISAWRIVNRATVLL
jgi:hypothetical protein